MNSSQRTRIRKFAVPSLPSPVLACRQYGTYSAIPPVMSTKRVRVPSLHPRRAAQGVTYQISVSGGELSCSCPDWRYRPEHRPCKHLRQLASTSRALPTAPVERRAVLYSHTLDGLAMAWWQAEHGSAMPESERAGTVERVRLLLESETATGEVFGDAEIIRLVRMFA